MLAMSGLLAGRAISTWAGGGQRPMVAVEAPMAGAGVLLASRVPTDAFLNRNVFGAAREDLIKPPKPDDRPVVSPGSEQWLDRCRPATMRDRLTATVVTSRDDGSVAVFVRHEGGAPVSLRIGDRLGDDITVTTIEWRRVTVDHGGQCEVLSLEDDPPAAPVVAMVQPGLQNELNVSVTSSGRGVYEIPRRDVDHILGRLDLISGTVRVMPTGRGLKVGSIRRGSLAEKFGLKNEDEVVAVNGYKLTDPGAMLEAYSRLKDADTLRVDVQRRGRRMTITVHIL